MRDIPAVFWLRWRQFRDSAVYWLRVLGYQQNEKSLSQNLYVVYLGGIGLVWFGAMWTFVYDTTNNLGQLLPLASLAALLQILPIIGLAIQVYVMVNALRSTPIKLSFADMAYLAGSPVSPTAPVIVGFVRQVILRELLFTVGFAAISVFLIRPLGPHLGTDAVFRAILATIPFVLLTWVFAWLLGVSRMVFPRLRRFSYFWVLPLLLFPLAYLLPDFFLWPSRAFLLNVYGVLPGWILPFILVLALVLVYILARLSERVNMVQATDESITYARIQALGLLAWRQIDLQFRIRLQSTQAARKPFLSLAKAEGLWMLMMRAGLSYLRHPIMLLLNLGWGAVMSYAAVLIVVNQLPIQVWIGWVLVVSFVPPNGLLYVFRVDLEERFLRQFLPFDGFQLFIADVLLPLIFLIGGAIGAWVLQGFSPDVTLLGILAIPILAIMLALCGAVALTNKRVLQTRLLATGLSFGAVILAAQALHSPFAALAVAVFALLILSGLVTQNA
ncbi:MAG: hypothetical protein ABI690_28185 [Chloroflexota bacterium]